MPRTGHVAREVRVGCSTHCTHLLLHRLALEAEQRDQLRQGVRALARGLRGGGGVATATSRGNGCIVLRRALIEGIDDG